MSSEHDFILLNEVFEHRELIHETPWGKSVCDSKLKDKILVLHNFVLYLYTISLVISLILLFEIGKRMFFDTFSSKSKSRGNFYKFLNEYINTYLPISIYSFDMSFLEIYCSTLECIMGELSYFEQKRLQSSDFLFVDR